MIWALPIIAVSFLALLVFEIRSVRERRLTKKREAAWPQFEEIVISALESGIPIAETFSYAQEFSLPVFHSALSGLVSNVDRGIPFSNALRTFANSVNIRFADLFVEVIDISSRYGGQNLVSSLKEHAESVRYELAATGEVEARNSAVLNVAKLGLLAPWVLLALLCANEANRKSFESNQGGVLLLGGFAISLLAFRLVALAGSPKANPRVFWRPAK